VAAAPYQLEEETMSHPGSLGFGFVRVLTLVAGSMFASTALPQEGGTILGRVVDVDERPVVSATVVVFGTDLEATTTADGSFEFRGVPPGEYGLQASGAGFAIHAVDSLTVSEGNTSEVIFRLEPVPLREVVVTSSVSILREEPAARVSLDRQQITELPHFGDDLYRAIAVLPGTSGGDISARFSIRGGLDDETLRLYGRVR
jgi:hypothetical protein